MSQTTVGYTESTHYRVLEDLEQTYTRKTINPLFLAYCGKEDCEQGYSFGPYIRENYVIHVVTKGRGVYTTRGRQYNISAGQMFIIYPEEETTYKADDEDPWTYMWIGFNGYRADAIAEEIGFSPDKPVMTLKDTDSIAAAVDRILECKDLTNTNLLRRMAALYDALALMIEHVGHEKTVEQANVIKYVNLAMDLITESYHKKIRISDIADRVGINRSYLSTIFRQELNMSPQEFLISYRLERAAMMLRDTKEAIGGIAVNVGYTDPLSFSKAFRQKFGVSPSEYRNSPPELAKREEKGRYVGTFHL